jgi:hypothetical protein
MSIFESNYSDSITVRTRERAVKIGALLLGFGIGSYLITEQSETERLLSVTSIGIGTFLFLNPILAEVQGRLRSKDEDDKDDGESGDDWPDDDDDPTPDAPNDPGGLTIDWINEVEDFLQTEDRQLVSVD